MFEDLIEVKQEPTKCVLPNGTLLEKAHEICEKYEAENSALGRNSCKFFVINDYCCGK